MSSGGRGNNVPITVEKHFSHLALYLNDNGMIDFCKEYSLAVATKTCICEGDINSSMRRLHNVYNVYGMYYTAPLWPMCEYQNEKHNAH